MVKAIMPKWFIIAERNTYRVIASSYDDRAEATQAKEEFKAKYPNRDDFQKAWLLYRVY